MRTLHTFTNITGGIKAVNAVGKGGQKMVNVDPKAKSPPLEVTDADMKKLEATGWFKISKATKEDGKAAVVVAPPAPADSSTNEPSSAEALLASIQDGGLDGGDADDDGGHDEDELRANGGEFEDDFSSMSDEALRAFITDRDEKAPHHKLGRDKLLALARNEADSEGV